MTMIKTTGGRYALPALVGLTLLVTGCGTKHVGSTTTAGTAVVSPTPRPAPTVPADFPCPGESPRPTPTVTTTDGPPDKWTENNGFKIPIPLHGQARCDGLAAVKKIQGALEPQRRRGDFAPETARTTLTGLGYAKVRTYKDGPTGVGFLIVGGPALCLEGTMSEAATTAEAFAGYPEGSVDCERPRGGH